MKPLQSIDNFDDLLEFLAERLGLTNWFGWRADAGLC